MTGYQERPARRGDATAWWSVTSGNDTLVLPDGCIDLIWANDRLFVAGPDTVAQPYAASAGTEVAGLRLHPGAAPAALGVPAHALVDQEVALSDLWAPDAAHRATELVAAAGPGEARAAALEAVIGAAATDETEPTGPPTAPPAAQAVVAELASHGSVAASAEALGWTERRLHRASLRWFGYGPKVLARIVRLQRALALARAGLPFARVAAEAGYADQPHLAREVRALTGTTLGELVSS